MNRRLAIPLLSVLVLAFLACGRLSLHAQETGKAALEAKLKAIVIPKVEFRDTTVSEALLLLKQKSIDHDKATTDAAQKGVNIIVKGLSTAKITLSLKDVPLGEALKYVTQLAGLHYSVEDTAVVVERP